MGFQYSLEIVLCDNLSYLKGHVPKNNTMKISSMELYNTFVLTFILFMNVYLCIVCASVCMCMYNTFQSILFFNAGLEELKYILYNSV